MMRGQTFFLVLTLLSSSLLTAQEDNASHGPTIIEVGSSAHQQGHPPAHAFDKSAASRWAAQGREHWIRLKLSEPTKLAGVLIGFTHGTRNYRFEVQARSASGWKKLMEFQSRGRGEGSAEPAAASTFAGCHSKHVCWWCLKPIPAECAGGEDCKNK